MIELRVLIDEIDYDSLVELLVPLAAEKHAKLADLLKRFNLM